MGKLSQLVYGQTVYRQLVGQLQTITNLAESPYIFGTKPFYFMEKVLLTSFVPMTDETIKASIEEAKGREYPDLNDTGNLKEGYLLPLFQVVHFSTFYRGEKREATTILVAVAKESDGEAIGYVELTALYGLETPFILTDGTEIVVNSLVPFNYSFVGRKGSRNETLLAAVKTAKGKKMLFAHLVGKSKGKSGANHPLFKVIPAPEKQE